MLAVLQLIVLLNILKQATSYQPPSPLNITVQPTDLHSCLEIALCVKLGTQGYRFYEYTDVVKIPCKAEAYPENVEYSWFKWSKTTQQWFELINKEPFTWRTNIDGHLLEFGSLTIKRHTDETIQLFNMTGDVDGAYICRAKSNYGIAVSQVLNLTTAIDSYGENEIYASTANVQKGQYVKLGLNGKYVDMTNPIPIWSLRDHTIKISPNRTQIDEKGELHIGYVDNSLLQDNVYKFHWTDAVQGLHFQYISYTILMEGEESSSEQCNFKYQTPSLSLVHGQSSRLVCVYAGSPSITVSYFKHDASGKPQQLTPVVADGEALLQTGLYGNTYMIGSAQTTDAGTYSCSATFKTSTGEERCHFQTNPIIVTVDLEPTFVSQPSPVTYVLEGQSVTLEWRIKGRPLPIIEFLQNPVSPLPVNMKYQFRNLETSDPVDGFPVYSRTFTLFKAMKPNDSLSLQVYARNPYHIAVSSVFIKVVSPITFPTKMQDKLDQAPNSTATFWCTAYADRLLVPTFTWTRYFNNAKYPVNITGAGGQYSSDDFYSNGPAGLVAFTQVLTVNSTVGGNLDSLRGYYMCNVSNAVTWNVTFAVLSFSAYVHVSVSRFDWWSFCVVCFSIAGLFFIVSIIAAVHRNRGATYELEKEEIRRGLDPKKEVLELFTVYPGSRVYPGNEDELTEPLHLSF